MPDRYSKPSIKSTMAGNKRVAMGTQSSFSCSSPSSTPPSALRKGKFDVSSPKSKSKTGLGIIYDAYGQNLSLYQVLHIHPSAEASELRKAYLTQGKAALVNGGVNMSDRGLDLQNYYSVPDDVRKKFQAVSLAYEVLSTPELRSHYDKYGDLPVKSSLNTRSMVRWDQFVEEKIIWDSHPDEHLRPNEYMHGKESRDAPNNNRHIITPVGKMNDGYDELEREQQSMVPFSPCSVIVQCMDYDPGSGAGGPFGILGLLPHNNDDVTECTEYTWEQLSDASSL